ncbi:hypothetical protein LTR02_018328, partial [Friedmanniomyces endolithicus]
MAQDDDDTNWSYPDKDREMVDRSSSNTLTDELTSMFGEDFSGTTLDDDGSTIATAGGETIR